MTVVAVTGGAGFIGSNLVRYLSSIGYQIKVIDDLSTGLESNLIGLNVDFQRISIVNQEEVKRALAKVDVIVHLAARGSVPRSVKDPLATHQVNTLGTINILEICREYGQHLIFSSSSSVYGANTQLPKNEKMWMRPISPYAASKLSAESFVSAYSTTYGLKTTPLRFFNVFGPWQRPDHEYAAVLPKWIWHALRGEAIELHGEGDQTRDFTYIDTVCQIISTAIEKQITTPEIINLAYGNNISLKHVLNLLSEKVTNLEITKLPYRVGDVMASQNDPTRLKLLFPDINPVPFENAFDETFNWLSRITKK